ncbi:hypothetical protein PVK06_018143 [Gossypium arboreum]|uniref:RNase H type-1 domain-containing protein n=1 Tax=Gossypium arboreum TaxID=29729 RepID=A0ABR0Q4U0_GOSAR|nr:hypothetical protein PVK06_018143 [Gossypium arboreum]
MNGSLLSTNFVVGKSLTRSNSGVGQAKKKVRRRTDPSPNMDDLIVDENGQKIEDVGVDKLLYKSMLMGTSPYVYLPEKLEEEFVTGRCWLPLDKGWITLNMDGVGSPNVTNACIGGVFRDSDANWLFRYSIVVGKDSIFRIEARVVLEGLCIAWERGFRQINVECDHVLLVETILVGGAASSRMVELKFIHLLLNRNWKVHFRHIVRSQNKVTDQMTKCEFNGNMGLFSFEEPPILVRNLLLVDRINPS